MHRFHLLRAFGMTLLLSLAMAALEALPTAAQMTVEHRQASLDGDATEVETVDLQTLSLPPLKASASPWIEQQNPLVFDFSTAVAQADSVTEPLAVEMNWESFRITPRVGAGYSTSSGGFPGLGYFEAFVPLSQRPGQTLSFLEGQINTGFDANLGGSLLLGYRNYDTNANRVQGGYLGFDGRGTGSNTFFGLGAGYENLGQTWDFRLNAYLPLGNSQRVSKDINVDTGVQTSTRFQGNLLLLESQRQRQRVLQTETALGGLDAEAGYRLAHWDQGDLRGFGGVYLYGSSATPTYLGWRLRLASNITPNFNAGVALQGDGLFGTRLILSLGATFPGIRSQDVVAKTDEVRARLGEPIVRQPGIAIAYQEKSEITNERFSQPLRNPETEAPYRFQHVNLGGSGGDGTFESPFGTVQTALGATQQDGNDVVYINGDQDLLIPAFTIPDRVQVLSQGPRQLLAGLPFPGFSQTTARLPFSPEPNYDSGIVVELPFSGDGNFPRTSGVILGNRTVLAGFRVENAVGDGISGNSISNVELRNNTVTNPGERGIFLDDVGGSLVLFDNAVTGARGSTPDSGQGILIRNTTTLRGNTVTIAGYRADNNRVGIDLVAVGSIEPTIEAPIQVITISPSSPFNTSIGISAGTTITNSASNNTEQGIRIQASILGSQEVAIAGATVSNNGQAGVDIISGTPGGFLLAFQEVQVRDSTIANNGGAGIRIEGNETAEQEFNIDGNRIINNSGAGIESTAGDSAIQEFVAKSEINSLGIGRNVIDGNGGPGITISTSNAEVLLVEANQNTFGTNANSPDGDTDLNIESNNSARTCTVVFGNTGAPNLVFTNNSSFVFQVSNLSNLSLNNSGAVVNLLPSEATFTNITPQTCL
ncbi:MAG TPA: right-handed parallel beta-helix repeat-containing protein [Trichocoleus sp.]